MNNDNLHKERECDEIIRKKDYYDILGVSKTADEAEIKRAYKKMAIKFHPDKNNADNSADAFKKISHAFQILSDKGKRDNYDRYGTEEGMTSNNIKFHNDMDPFDLFNMFFQEMGGMNGGGRTTQRGGSSKTEYVFNNGNVSYRVYTSGGNTFQTMFNNFEDNEEEGFDPLHEMLFRGQQQKRKKRPEQNEGVRRKPQNLFSSLMGQLMPLMCVIIIFILPYIYRRF
jgi:curved DNA-binding protein CbpA